MRILTLIRNFFVSTDTLWLICWSVLLALAWLLPNHYLPWTSFHSETWAAIVILFAAGFSAFVINKNYKIDLFSIIILISSLIPVAHYVFGKIDYFGTSWISFLYILGFFLSIQTGKIWGQHNNYRLIDALALAISIGAVVSTYIQLRQWLDVGGASWWIVDATTRRPSANLAQPNQLATLQIWGVLSVFWGVTRHKLRLGFGLPVVFLLLFGVALTGSRTAWIAVVLLVAATWLWLSVWRSRRPAIMALGLGLYFALCVVIVGYFDSSNLNRIYSLGAVGSDPRLDAWRIFIDAIIINPLSGYGWEQGAHAHIFLATNHPALNVVFTKSHNLFIDLIVWCGVPAGLFLTATLLLWVFKQIRSVNNKESAILILFIVTVGNHAMLEFPLHYAYFLLPTGLIMGSISPTIHSPTITLGRKGFVSTLLLGVFMLSVTIVDYTKIEHSYSILRWEWAGINLDPDPRAPPTLALNQWSEAIALARQTPRAGMREDELDRLRDAALNIHRPIDFKNLAISLHLNNQPKEAYLWLDRLCKVQPEDICRRARSEFEAVKERDR